MSAAVARVATEVIWEIVGESLWETMVSALRPALQIIGITLPATFPTLNLISDQGRRLDQQFQDFFIGMFDQAGIVWQLVVRPAIAQIISQITLSLPTVASLSLAIREAIRNFFANDPLIIATIVAAINQALPTALSQVNDAFSTLVKQLILMFSEFFITTWEPTLSNTVDIIGRLGTILNEYLIPIRTNLDLAINNFGNLVRDNLPEIIDAVNDGVAAALADVGNFVNSAVSMVNQAIQTQLTQLGELEYYISTEFKFWVGEASEYIINSLRGQQQNDAIVVGSITAVGTAMTNQFTQASVERQNYYNELTNKIANSCICVQDAIIPALSGVGGGFGQGLKDVITEPSKLLTAAALGGIGASIGAFMANPCGAIDGITTFTNDVVGTMTKWVTSICVGCDKILPDDLSTTISRVLNGMLGVGGGLGLSMMAGELVAPLKQMGFGRLAAYFWDMADFKAVGGAVLGQLNFASTIQPLKYGLNEFFRTNEPTVEDQTRWFYRIDSDIANVETSLKRHGFADKYIENYVKDIYQPISQRVVLNMIETPGIELDWIRGVLKAHGVSPGDREVLIAYARRKRLSDEFSELKSAYESAYIAGYVGRDTYFTQLQSIGRSDNEILWAIYAADRKEETARLKEAIDIIVSAFRAGNLSQPSFEDEIMLLPLVPAKAQNLIEKELARKRITATTQRALKQANLSVSEILKGLDYDIFNEDGVLARLQALNYTLEDANLILLVHKSELAAKLADENTKIAARAELDAARDEQRLALEWARFLTNAIIYRSISPEAAKDLIAALPLADARKELFYKEIDINASRPAGTGTADKPKSLREADVYKSLSYQLITYQEALDYLTAKGYTAEQAALLLQLNAPESVPLI